MKNEYENENISYFSDPTDSGNISESDEIISEDFNEIIPETELSESSIESSVESSIEISDVIIPSISGRVDGSVVSLNTCINSENSGSEYKNPSEELVESLNPTQIIIIGTAHVSEKSVREVKETIEREKPDIVAVELDQNRFKGMTEPESSDAEISFKDVLKPGQTFYYLLYAFLAYMQKKMGDQLGVQPGSEMMAAVEGAREIGAGIALIDRDIQVTFKRFLAKLSFLEKIKMVYKIVKSMIFDENSEEEFDIGRMTDQDVVTAMIEEFRNLSPTAASVLIDERDAYLAGNLLKLVQQEGTGKKIVVVIGAGHRQGMMKYLNNPASVPNLQDLIVVPKKRFGLLKIISYGIIALVFLAFAYILYSVITYPDMTPDVLLTAFGIWFLVTGTLSALGVLIAGGKPKSALVAFSLAWFTALHPLLAAGWFAGLAEAGIRKPTSKDMKGLMNAETFKELNSNSFFKVIFVAALSNVGCMIGTFIGAYLILKISKIDVVEIMKTIISGLF